MDEQKTEKNGFPTPWMNEKLKKVPFQPLGSEKNAENSPSAVNETRKSRKNAHRRSTKRRNHEKTLVVGRRNAEIAKKYSSAVDETRKSQKNARRRSTKRKKRRKSIFGRGRRVKNDENSISATAETEKTLKITFPTPWKQKKIPQNSFNALRETQKYLKTALTPYGKRKNSLKMALTPYEKRKNSLKMALTPYGKCKNSLKIAFPPYGKCKNSLKAAFSPYGKCKNSLKMTLPPYEKRKNSLNIAHIASHLVVIARTKGLCYRNSKASTRSVAEAHDKEHDTARSSHSSQCTDPYPASHNHRIDNQIQLLEDIAQNKGRSKCQNGAERCT